MKHTVKIRTLPAPPTPLHDFDPGKYLTSLEFYETQTAITDKDRDDFAQFIHLLAFVALQARSTRWPASNIPRHTLAFAAIDSHFSHLPDWPADDLAPLTYRRLATFLMLHFPPHRP